MKLNKVKVFLLCLCLMMSFVFVDFTLNFSPASALVQQATIYIDPTPVTALVCQNFTVAVRIKDVTDLYAWQLKLTFDPNLLECLSVTEGPFLSSWGPTIFPPPVIDNTAGSILAACVLMLPGPGASGSGVLAYIKFHCDGPGECDLVIAYPDTFLLDSNFISIPRIAVKGHVYQKVFTRYLHKEEPIVPVHLHKEEPIVPVHMNSNMTLTPVHMHFTGPPGQDPILYPKGTYWHELYPQFCEPWFLTSWIDNGDEVLSPNDQIDMMDMLERVTWYHVDRITWTILLSNISDPEDQMYVEYKGSFEPGKDPINDPVCTYWHEVYPMYCNVYHIIWIDPAPPLEYCKLVYLQDIYTGEVTLWHVDDVATDLILREKIMDPRCTWWHEIYPNYCEWSHLTSWEDTGYPFGQLSPSDQIDMDREPTDEWYWETFWSMGDVNRDGYINEVDVNLIAAAFCSRPGDPNWNPDADLDKDGHVGVDDAATCARNYGKNIWTYFPDLGKRVWYHVDRVTLTLNVTSQIEPTRWMKIELKTSYFEEMYNALKHPLDTLWHEIYPYYSNIYQLVGWDWWEDDNCNGVLDVCDYIWLLNVASGLVERYHVEDICYDIILTKKCFYEPIGTQWHELYPEYCRRFNLTSWIDTNQDYKLSPSDQIDMTDKETGEVTWYHVDRVTLTIKLMEEYVPEPIPLYAELVYSELFFQTIMNPVPSYWHVVYPLDQFSRILLIESWEDNCNGVLSFCDQIDGRYMDDPEITHWYHVEEIACDIILTKKCFYEPIGTQWHELYPEYCRNYRLTSWEDTNLDSKLSPSDYIDLTDKETGEVTWHHVDMVTLTIKLKEKYVPVPLELYAEFTSPFEMFFEPIMNPICTYWHVVYPPEAFSRIFHITSWEDNGDGVLSYCDQIDVEFEHEPGIKRWYHVEEIACDIKISCKTGIVVAGSEDTNVYAWDFSGNLLWMTPTIAPVLSVAMDNNGTYVAAGSRLLGTNTGALYFMDASNGAILWSKDLLISESYDGGWRGTESKSVDVKYNHYNQCDIVAAAHDNGLNLYDQWGNLIWAYWDEFHETIVRISQDGNYIVCANYESGFFRGGVHYFSHLTDGTPGWGPGDGTPVWTLPTSQLMSYFWVAISGIGDYIAASGYRADLGYFVSLHDRTGALIWRYTTPQGLKGGYIRVDMPCDGKSVVAVNDDPGDTNGCDLLYWNDGCDGWDLADGVPIWSFWPTWPAAQNPGHDFYTVAISGDGSTIATGGEPRFDYMLSNAGPPPLLPGPIGPRPDNPQSVDLTFDGVYGASVGGSNLPGGPGPAELWFERKAVGLLWTWTNPSQLPFHSVAISKIYPCMFPYPDHDVDVHNVTRVRGKSVVNQGYKLKIEVTLSNEGDFTETTVLKLWTQSNASETYLINQTTVTVLPSTYPVMTFEWDPSGVPYYRYYKIFATVNIVKDEINVYDNTFVDCSALVTGAGDISGSVIGVPDRKVDMKDVYPIAKAFFVEYPDPRYNANFDITCDGKIDMKDIYPISKNFMKTYP